MSRNVCSGTFFRSAVWILCIFLPSLSGQMLTDRSLSAQSPQKEISAQPIESVTEKGPVKMTLRVSPSQPRLSDIVDLEVLIEGTENVAIEPPVFGQAVGDFMVLDYSERKADLQGRSVPANSRLFHYRLEPVHSGTHLIRSLAIEFTDNRPESEAAGQKVIIESKPIEVTITSELDGQVPDLANLEPMLSPVAIRSKIPWGWILPLIMLISIFLLLLWATKSTKKKSTVAVTRPASEVAQEKLEILLSENLPARGLVKEFYLRLTAIVREFIEDSTGIRAPEQTTEEFLRDERLGTVFTSEQSNRLKEFLEAADMVKYAGTKPDQVQMDLSVERAREFIAIRFSQRSPSVASSELKTPDAKVQQEMGAN